MEDELENIIGQYKLSMTFNTCWQEYGRCDDIVCRRISDEQIISALKKFGQKENCSFKPLSEEKFLGVLTVNGRGYFVGKDMEKLRDIGCYQPDDDYICNVTLTLSGRFATKDNETEDKIHKQNLFDVKDAVYAEYPRMEIEKSSD